MVKLMTKVLFDDNFGKTLNKIKDSSLKEKIRKQVLKIIENPEVGKPMKHSRKGTREVYIRPFRLSYVYFKEEGRLVFLDFYHKDEQ